MTLARTLRLSWVILLAATAIFGQSDRGSIRGTISDTSGGVIPGAKVTASNVANGVVSSTVTTSVGLYDIPSLPAGTYSVKVEQPGFKTLSRDRIEVHVNDTVALDLTMEVGATAEVVSVQAAAPVLKTASTELSTSVNPRTYLDLPINSGGGLGRIATSFMNLAPGVRGGNAFSYSTNGGQRFSHQILIDGLDVSGVYANPGDDRPVTLPPDALQEFTLVTNSYSAEFGNVGGGILSFTVRSGTNDYHGDAYEFLRNGAFDSRGFYPADVAQNRQHEFGAQIGGPVRISRSV